MVKVKMFSKEGRELVKNLKKYSDKGEIIFHDTDSITLTIRDFEKYKLELLKKKKERKLREGTYSNRSTAINNFIKELIELKKLDPYGITADTKIRITASDIYKIFKKWEEELSKHTFRVYVNCVKIALEDILLENGLLLSKRIPQEVFNYKLYYRNTSESLEIEKGEKLKAFNEYESYKAVASQRIRDTFAWLVVLKKEKLEKGRMSLITWYRFKIATLLLTFTGARGTEIVDLEFFVKTKDGDKVKQIDLKNGLIYFIRNKVKEKKSHRDVTPVFIPEPLVSELKIYKNTFGVNKLFNWSSLDKMIKDYFTPVRRFNKEELNGVYRKYKFLQRYNPNRPIITVSQFRKYLDNWFEQKSINFIKEQIYAKYNKSLQELFGSRWELTYTHLNKLKNFFLGRVEGIDFINYDAFFGNKKLFKNMKTIYKWFMEGFVETLEPEILWILEPQTVGKLAGDSIFVQNLPFEQKSNILRFEQEIDMTLINKPSISNSKPSHLSLNNFVQTIYSGGEDT